MRKASKQETFSSTWENGKNNNLSNIIKANRMKYPLLYS